MNKHCVENLRGFKRCGPHYRRKFDARLTWWLKRDRGGWVIVLEDNESGENLALLDNSSGLFSRTLAGAVRGVDFLQARLGKV